jgi:hypothetical protein
MLNTQYQQRITELESQLEQLQSRNLFLEEQFRLAQQKRFGASSEGPPGQGELFNEAEVELEQPEPEEEPTKSNSWLKNQNAVRASSLWAEYD